MKSYKKKNSCINSPIVIFTVRASKDRLYNHWRKMIIKVLQIIAVIATILTGLVSLLNPQRVTRLHGINRPVADAASLRSARYLADYSSGWASPSFCSARVRPIRCLASCTSPLAWCGSFPSFWINPRCSQSNWISLVVEIIFGIILVI